MPTSGGEHNGEIPWQTLKPYFTVTVVQHTGTASEHACEHLLDELGLRDSTDLAGSFPAHGELDEVHAFVHRTQDRPAWTSDDAFVDTRHRLTLVLRRNDLIAIHTYDAPATRLQRLLREPGPYRRIPPRVLESALLPGETRGLWLRGIHRRRPTLPDSKHLSGIQLREALNPLEDASFAVSAGRAALPPGNGALAGVVGTTPRKSSVWLKRATDWPHFLALTADLLALLENRLHDPAPDTPVFPGLARPVDDLSAVRGAFDVVALPPSDLPATPDDEDELRAAAELLATTSLEVTGDPDSSAFVLDIDGRDRVEGRVQPHDGGYRAVLDTAADAEIRAALELSELLTVHYRSGHALLDGQLWERENRTAPFPNWRFRDFTGYWLDREKPQRKRAQDVHDAIGARDDRSLFTWVADHFNAGWLTCDDGSGEIADFLHLSHTGQLTLVHVKAVRKAGGTRGMSAQAYEVVSAQATKNLVHTDRERLRRQLQTAPVPSPATWTDGVRVDDRGAFLAALDRLDATCEIRAAIVQPHLTAGTYRRVRGEQREPPSDDFLRLCLLETMLNTARAGAVALGADLEVITSAE